MGRNALPDGTTANITFPHGSGACNFDIEVKYDDDDTAEWTDIDLCQYAAISLFWDKTQQATRAAGE